MQGRTSHLFWPCTVFLFLLQMWVEPQFGVVTNSSEERKQCDGLNYSELTQAVSWTFILSWMRLRSEWVSDMSLSRPVNLLFPTGSFASAVCLQRGGGSSCLWQHKTRSISFGFQWWTWTVAVEKAVQNWADDKRNDKLFITNLTRYHLKFPSSGTSCVIYRPEGW